MHKVLSASVPRFEKVRLASLYVAEVRRALTNSGVTGCGGDGIAASEDSPVIAPRRTNDYSGGAARRSAHACAFIVAGRAPGQ
jgi:hypothetical protein